MKRFVRMPSLRQETAQSHVTAATAPPSISTSVPVTKLAASEQRNAITEAPSSRRPDRPDASAATTFAVPAVSESFSAPIGASIAPGEIDKIRPPRIPQREASLPTGRYKFLSDPPWARHDLRKTKSDGERQHRPTIQQAARQSDQAMR